jgi:hypothetical protein
MPSATVSHRPVQTCLEHVISIATVAATIACGSAAERAPGGAGGAMTRSPGPSPSAAPSAGSGGATAGSVEAGVPPSGISGSANQPMEGNPTPASLETAAVDEVCSMFGTSDACAGCVCAECSSELVDCAETPGCAEILACVRESGCTGTDCYCGDAVLIICIGGAGNGPCKDVVLAAPGGRQPTVADPSGGPASDAALRIADCAEEEGRCADVCDIGD